MDATRRQALAGAAALALAGALPRPVLAIGSENPRAVRPGRLRPGDTVGLVNPAGAVWEPVNVEIVAESLAALGFKTKRGANLLARHGYFAGTDEQRAADLNGMFADPDVRAIHCVRGGWGCARILPLLDWKTIAKSPRSCSATATSPRSCSPCTRRPASLPSTVPWGARNGTLSTSAT